ncbi:hypothetical protein QSI_1850 [Clostridioides difficile P28]|nr:hypothetical protein QSI_1850 [Clostridioides difficile P28]
MHESKLSHFAAVICRLLRRSSVEIINLNTITALIDSVS